MSPSDYEMIEQGYDPPRVTHPLERVEEIVAVFESDASPDWPMLHEHVVALIASWRERGELLREALEALSDEYGKTDVYARIDAALKDRP